MESSSDNPDGDYHSWLLWILLNNVSSPTTGVIIAFIAVILLICCSALISGSEVAFFSLTEKEFNKLRERADRASNTIFALISKPRYLLATILISNNLVNVAIVITSYFIFSSTIDFSGNKYLGFFIQVILVTFILVLFGEVLPKVYATRFNLRLASFMAIPLSILNTTFRPVSYFLVTSTKLIEKRIKKKGNEFNPEELEQAIDLTTGTKTSPEEVNMLKGIVKFGNTTVKQIMRSRVDMVAVDKNMRYNELLDIIKQSGYSRIPVYEENLDNIIGVLYVKDLLEHLEENEQYHWQTLIRQPVFTPESKKIDDLLKEIQESRVHLIVAVDEYGGTSGIITLEDILEEIIGDIRDEYDMEDDVEFEKIDNNNYIFEGKTLLKDICKVMGLKDDVFDEARGEADSLAGLILELSGKFPNPNEELNYRDFTFKVVSIGKNRIQKVKITVNDDVLSEKQ